MFKFLLKEKKVDSSILFIFIFNSGETLKLCHAFLSSKFHIVTLQSWDLLYCLFLFSLLNVLIFFFFNYIPVISFNLVPFYHIFLFLFHLIFSVLTFTAFISFSLVPCSVVLSFIFKLFCILLCFFFCLNKCSFNC